MKQRMYGKICIHTEFLKKILERRRHLLEIGKSGKEILKLIAEKHNVGLWTGFILCNVETNDYKQGNRISAFITCIKFLLQLKGFVLPCSYL
jgi:hypothetical protein